MLFSRAAGGGGCACLVLVSSLACGPRGERRAVGGVVWMGADRRGPRAKTSPTR